MMAAFVDVDPVAALFGLFNGLRLVSYLPQIVAVARDRNGARSISFSCWSIWIGANASTAAYAGLRLGDPALAAVGTFNAVCCATVLGIAACKRAAWRRAQPAAADCRRRPGAGYALNGVTSGLPAKNASTLSTVRS